MTDSVLRCPDHGYVTPDDSTSACPECGADAEPVLSGDRRRRLSKFVSGALRHFPDDAGLDLDDRGWVDYGDLARAVTRKYDWAEPEHLDAVVATDPKGRFERRGRPASSEGATSPRAGDDRARIRAAYGHSVDVTLADDAGGEIPDRLYHGTDPANLDAIRSEGLRPMGRREVHLSESPDDAREVGRRHASNPVVLAVDAAAMLADGRRVSKRGDATYTTDAVPPTYLDVLDE